MPAMPEPGARSDGVVKRVALRPARRNRPAGPGEAPDEGRPAGAGAAGEDPRLAALAAAVRLAGQRLHRRGGRAYRDAGLRHGAVRAEPARRPGGNADHRRGTWRGAWRGPGRPAGPRPGRRASRPASRTPPSRSPITRHRSGWWSRTGRRSSSARCRRAGCGWCCGRTRQGRCSSSRCRCATCVTASRSLTCPSARCPRGCRPERGSRRSSLAGTLEAGYAH